MSLDTNNIVSPIDNKYYYFPNTNIDLILIFKQFQFHVHQTILIQKSKYFQVLLQDCKTNNNNNCSSLQSSMNIDDHHNNKNNSHSQSRSQYQCSSCLSSIRTIELPSTLSCSESQLNHFFTCIYSIRFDEKYVRDVLKDENRILYLSHYFDCEYLLHECEQRLISHTFMHSFDFESITTVNTTFMLLSIASQYNLKRLLKTAIKQCSEYIVRARTAATAEQWEKDVFISLDKHKNTIQNDILVQFIKQLKAQK